MSLTSIIMQLPLADQTRYFVDQATNMEWVLQTALETEMADAKTKGTEAEEQVSALSARVNAHAVEKLRELGELGKTIANQITERTELESQGEELYANIEQLLELSQRISSAEQNEHSFGVAVSDLAVNVFCAFLRRPDAEPSRERSAMFAEEASNRTAQAIETALHQVQTVRDKMESVLNRL